jgi:hypothetical protein
MKRVALYGTVFVLIHLVINLLHGRAHTELHIGLSSFQLLFVVGVIIIGPLLALVLLWTQRQRLGLVLLITSMAGACLFGLYYHFVVPSPDHIAHVPAGFWGDLFRLTAVVLAVVEGLSAAVGWSWLSTHAAVPQTPQPAGIH